MFLEDFLEEITLCFGILGPRIWVKIYLFLSEIMDKGSVIFSLALHKPGATKAGLLLNIKY